MKRVLNIFGWRFQVDYEVQVQDSQGDFRTWNDGFASLESAIENMNDCIARDVRFNKYIKGVFRVQKKVSFIKYYEPDGKEPSK